MAEFHTVSISNNLSLCELYKINDIYFHNKITGELSTENIKNKLTKLYPRGISIYDMSYLSTKPEYHSKDNYKDNLISNMKHIESLFE